MSRVSYLDGIRGLLAITVAINHAYGMFDGWAPDRPFSGASLAVTYFFIMSGFVLSIQLERTGPGFRSFFIARLLKLWPLYAIFVTLTLSVLWFNSETGGFLPYWNIAPQTVISNYMFLVNIGITDAPALNGPSWSIGIEFWISALLMVLFRRLHTVALAAVCLLGYSAVFTYSQLTNGAYNIVPFLNSGMVTAAAGLALGCLCYRYRTVFTRLAERASPKVILTGYTAAFYACLWALTQPNGHRIDFIYILPFTLFLFPETFQRGSPRLHGIFAHPVVVWLGRISFSLYLLHWPALILLVKYKDYLGPTVHVQVALFICLVIFLAHISRQSMEIPIEASVKRFFRGGQMSRPVDVIKPAI